MVEFVKFRDFAISVIPKWVFIAENKDKIDNALSTDCMFTMVPSFSIIKLNIAILNVVCVFMNCQLIILI